RRDDPHLGRGVADPHADDVREAASPHAKTTTRYVLPLVPTDVRPDDRALRDDVALGAGSPGRHADGGRGNTGPDRAALHRRTQRLLPDPGRRSDPGDLRSAANRLVPGDGRPPAGPGPGDPEGSGGRKPLLV